MAGVDVVSFGRRVCNRVRLLDSRVVRVLPSAFVSTVLWWWYVPSGFAKDKSGEKGTGTINDSKCRPKMYPSTFPPLGKRSRDEALGGKSVLWGEMGTGTQRVGPTNFQPPNHVSD